MRISKPPKNNVCPACKGYKSLKSATCRACRATTKKSTGKVQSVVVGG